MRSKTVIRETIRRQRQGLTKHTGDSASRVLWSQLKTIHAVKKAKTLAAYFAVNNEIDPSVSLHHLRQSGKTIFLPKLNDHSSMTFLTMTDKSSMRTNNFGIPEPGCTRAIETKQLDVILLPLVAFDRKKNRLGMGGGFYDRSLAFIHERPFLRKRPYLIGIAHSFQQVNTIECEPWDIALDLIVTPDRIFK